LFGWQPYKGQIKEKPIFSQITFQRPRESRSRDLYMLFSGIAKMETTCFAVRQRPVNAAIPAQPLNTPEFSFEIYKKAERVPVDFCQCGSTAAPVHYTLLSDVASLRLSPIPVLQEICPDVLNS